MWTSEEIALLLYASFLIVDIGWDIFMERIDDDHVIFTVGHVVIFFVLFVPMLTVSHFNKSANARAREQALLMRTLLRRKPG